MTTEQTAAPARRLPTKTNPMKTYLRGFAMLVAWLAIVVPLQGLAATYFVNSNSGNDNYNGLAPAFTSGTNGPWQTLAKLANVTLAPNDTVYLACGAVWNETLRVPSSGALNVPITIAAGPGTCTTPPLIDGAVTIPAHAWIQHSGSIYKARLPFGLISNPGQSPVLSGWSPWSPTGNSTMVVDNACPGQTAPCMAFTSGTSYGVAMSNVFPLVAGTDYSAAVQFRAPAGTVVRALVRRAGPTYESFGVDQSVTANGTWQSINVAFRPSVSLANARMDIVIPATGIRVNLRSADVRRAQSPGSPLAVFADGLQIRRAHHPNFGQGGNVNSPYAVIATAGGKTIADATNLVLPSGATLATGLGVTVRTVDWAIEERVVTGISGRRLTLSAPTNYNINAGYGFFMTGALWMLDAPGEWFYDSLTSDLYVWMPDGAAPGIRLASSWLPQGVDLGTRSNVIVRGLAIRHVGTGVALLGSSAVTLSSVSISDTVDYAINAENCVSCKVQTSAIARSGLDAINMRGGQMSGFAFTDSIITDSGASIRTDGWRMLPRPAFGAIYSPGVSTSIQRSKIVGAAYVGAFLGPLASVSDNYVSQTCLTMNDCGGIYVNHTGPNATITRNVIENLPGNTAGVPVTQLALTVGIYLDDNNSGTVVSGNTVTGAEYGVGLHNANGATIASNILAGNRRLQVWANENTQAVRSAGDVFGNVINSNVMVPSGSGPALDFISSVGNTADFAALSSNHYSALLTSRVIAEVTPSGGSSFTVPEWQAAAREIAPRVTQPVGYTSFLIGSGNLIPNPAFADGDQGWSWWNAAAPLATITMRTCVFGPCLDLNAGATESMVGSPPFSITAGQWYRASFDAKTGQNGQPILAIIRRGGGGTASKEPLIPVPESFSGSTSWRRYSFTFQAAKTVIAGDPVTQELGARLNFERNQPGTILSIGRVEMVMLTPAQVALQTKLLLNRELTATNVGCSTLGVAQTLCSSFVYFQDDSPVSWPAPVAALSGRPIYTRDTTLTDSDYDGIADQQDYCPSTATGLLVNARGCAITQ